MICYPKTTFSNRSMQRNAGFLSFPGTRLSWEKIRFIKVGKDLGNWADMNEAFLDVSMLNKVKTKTPTISCNPQTA